MQKAWTHLLWAAPYMAIPPIYLFSKPPTFDSTFLTMLPENSNHMLCGFFWFFTYWTFCVSVIPFIVAIYLSHMQSYFNHIIYCVTVTFLYIFLCLPPILCYCPCLCLIYHFLLCSFFYWLSNFFFHLLFPFGFAQTALFFLYWLSYFFSPFAIWICLCSPHFLFSLLFHVLSVVFLRSWCSCDRFLFVLLIFFLLLF